MFARFRTPLLTAQQLDELSQNSQCLEQDGHGPKVLLLPNGNILKIFYPRKGASLSRVFPAAFRFVRNAKALQQRGIATVTVTKVWRLENEVFSVLYEPVPGLSLRQILDESPEQLQSLRADLARYIDTLHARGIYFRSLHLGNVIQLPSGEFGLIDIADLRLYRSALRRGLVHRNRAHFEHYVAKEGLDFDCAALWRLSSYA